MKLSIHEFNERYGITIKRRDFVKSFVRLQHKTGGIVCEVYGE